MSTTTREQITAGTRLRFDDKATSWLVRAVSDDGRYALATASIFGAVHYTIIDHDEHVRGAMNVIGGGLGINTTSGPDENIDEAMLMLRPSTPWPEGVTSRPAELRGFEVSHRNRVPLRITGRRSEGERTWTA